MYEFRLVSPMKLYPKGVVYEGQSIDFVCQSKNSEAKFINRRCYWLIQNWRSLSDEVCQKALQNVDRLQDYFNDEKVSEWFTAYEAAERAVSIIYFREKKVGDKYESYLLDLGEHIIRHLEEFGSRSGNHLYNQARALALIGASAGREDLVRMGHELLVKSFSRIAPNGALLERSSSYHILLVSWIAEAIALSEKLTGVCTHVLDQVRKTLREHLYLTNVQLKGFYIPGGDYFVIGDFTPDCHYEWLIGNDKSTSEHITWNHLYSNDTNFQLGPSEFRGGQIRETFLGISVICDRFSCFVVGGASLMRPGHGHADFGSLIIYRDNEMLIGDLGRSTYNKGLESEIGLGRLSHSGPFLKSGDIFCGFSQKSGVELLLDWMWCQKSNNARRLVYSIFRDGFKKQQLAKVIIDFYSDRLRLQCFQRYSDMSSTFVVHKNSDLIEGVEPITGKLVDRLYGFPKNYFRKTYRDYWESEPSSTLIIKGKSVMLDIFVK